MEMAGIDSLGGSNNAEFPRTGAVIGGLTLNILKAAINGDHDVSLTLNGGPPQIFTLRGMGRITETRYALQLRDPAGRLWDAEFDTETSTGEILKDITFSAVNPNRTLQ